MRVLAKTFGWLLVSGAIIFISNVTAGVDLMPALIGAAFAKIGTTIAYLFYEVGFERAWKRQPKAPKKDDHSLLISDMEKVLADMGIKPPSVIVP